MTHAKAVREELKRWRVSSDAEALILAFCACVAMKMRGKDMDDLFLEKPIKPKANSP